MNRISWAAAAVLVAFFSYLLWALLAVADRAGDSSEVMGPDLDSFATLMVTATPDQSDSPGPTPTAADVPPTPTTSSEAPPVAEITPTAAFEVTVISAEVPANVRQEPTTEAHIVGVIPLGIKAKVVGQASGQEAYAGSGIRIWYFVSRIPPDLPEDGFVYSGVVVRAEGDQ